MRNSPVLLVLLAIGLSGCATKDYVRDQIASLNQRMDSKIDGVNGSAKDQFQSLNGNVKAENDRLAQDEGNLSQTSTLAHDALERANAAHVLAQGKLLEELVLSDDKVKFAFDKAVLSKDAIALLGDFATHLKTENQNVYIEIQGHTDSTGTAAYNQHLGHERAEAVRDYLNQVGIPLNRMNVISYGATRPVVDNKTRAHRKENRRVVLEVLK
jgi:peptidoglycan-associated lipoprotein